MIGTRPLHGDRMVPAGHLDLAVNVVPGGPPAWMRAALASVDVTRYPDARTVEAALAARHGRPAGSALALPGAAEGFWLLAAALRPRQAAIVTPAFTEAATALRAHGAVVTAVPRTAPFALQPDAVPDDADLVVVGNPCNPTGTLHDAERVLALARPGRTLLVDEAFMDLVPGEPQSVAGRGDVPGLVVLRSLTKSLGIPGVRAGYLLAAPETVRELDANRQPWPVGAHALAALAAYAQRPAPVADVAERVAAARERLERRLGELPGVVVYPGAANFVCVGVPRGDAVRAALADAAIAVRPTTDLGLDPDHFRIAVRDDPTTDRLVAVLRAALERCLP